MKATGCIMAKCVQCGVEVLDDTLTCPLCRSVLKPTEELENMYPNARVTMRKRIFFSRIYLFCGILTEVVLILLNAWQDSMIWWSAIAGLGILYSYMVLRYAIIGKAGYRSKVAVLSMIALMSIVATDFIIGYRGWSVDYVLPAGILLMDVSILGCMAFNKRNWQSYIMWQLAMVLFSLIPMFLYLTGLENNRWIAFAPLVISLLVFSGTMIIGGRRAGIELSRRFHF